MPSPICLSLLLRDTEEEKRKQAVNAVVETKLKVILEVKITAYFIAIYNKKEE